MPISPLDAEFFDAYGRCFGPLSTVQTERTPPDMLLGPGSSPGWVLWQPVPCYEGLMARMLAELEEESRCRLPPSFRRWYSSYHTLHLDLSVVRLATNPSNDPAGPLREMLTEDDGPAAQARDRSLLPFGREARLDAGPLCFDTRGGGDPDRWPITFWDHEWGDGEEAEDEVRPVLFSCFDRLLAGCTAYLRAFTEVKRTVAEGDWLAHRQPCFEALMAADRDGAGGPGRPYWSQGG